MQSIKCLQKLKLNNEEVEFADELANVKDVWGLFVPFYRSKENAENGVFSVDVEPNFVGSVIQYEDGHYECNLNTIDFQTEYTEEKLKEIIIMDIASENTDVVGLFLENVNNYTKFIKEGVEEIKKVDSDLVNLNQ